jgi:DNA repair exonuclease SbcCD nuclease subunit
MRFLHTADWQLGMTRHFLDADAQPRYHDARLASVRRIGALARELACEFVLVCGDVFETNAVAPRVVGRALAVLADYPVPVYLLPGNHDPLDPASVYRSKEFRRQLPEQVIVLDEAGPVRVGSGNWLVAAPWLSKHPAGDPVGLELRPPDVAARAASDPTRAVRVLAGHGMIDRLTPDLDQPGLIRSARLEAALAAGWIDYVALGDRHSTTQVDQAGRIWYSGTPEVTDFDEVEPGQVLEVDLEPGQAPKVTRHSTGSWVFVDLAHEFAPGSGPAGLAERLAAFEAKDRTVLRLSLRGTLTVAERAELDDLLAAQEHLFASVRLWQRHTDLGIRLAGGELAALGLSGYASQAAARLAELAAPGGADEAARAAADALTLLHRLAGAR